tara:strand:- start:54 stop:332 length:279 start_codon:yes stop_codon:yes gene_type:complete
MSIILSKHATARLQQRFGREIAANLIDTYGSPCEGGVMLNVKDIAEAEAELRHQIRVMSKLKNAFLAVARDENVAKTGLRLTGRQHRLKTRR